MSKLNIGKDLYLKGRIGWQGLSKDEYLTDGDYKIINATALMDGYVDWENCGYITKERFEEAKDIQLKENDILISKDGTLGKIGYVKNLTTPCSVASGVFVLRNTKPELVDFDYLYHILKSHIFKDFINRNKALGSTISHLYQRDLNDFELELPTLEEQLQVAKVLNDIDSKIENNNKIISELESMAKTIYDYWFLQFEFPNEDGKPYKSSGGKMVWNDELKREIPEGWEIKQLGCFANLYQPKTISEKDLNSNGKYFVYGANGIIGKYDKFNHQDREIAICCRGASCGNYVMTIPNSWITGNSMIVSTKNKEFIYYSLSKSTIDNYITGSAQPQITRTNLESAKFLIPSSKILNEFERKATTVRSKIETIFYENQELASLRDFLLPLLMNGQVTFKEEL